MLQNSVFFRKQLKTITSVLLEEFFLDILHLLKLIQQIHILFYCNIAKVGLRLDSSDSCNS